MKARPTIFLSGVSNEFGSFRDAVEIEVQVKGCFPHNQPSFGPDYRTVEETLRRKLHDADAVIHIVGFRFGAEPNQPPVNTPRRSYTQMEFDIARELNKPVYVFLSRDANVRDAPKPDEQSEDAKTTALQLVHREAVQKTNKLYYFFKDQAELCNLVAQVPVVQAAGFQADISRIIKSAPAELIGREVELTLLNEAWGKVQRADSPRPHILSFVALGGEGKTSLVAKWAAELAHIGWPGCDTVFAWSFYSQGTREHAAASSDLFLAEALHFFGDADLAQSNASGFDKARRLAQLVGEQRALLILDGVEPLQYAPTSPTPGELKDQGIAALLKALATSSLGLCVVTTRYAIPDLRAFWQTTAPQIELKRLSQQAGVSLLRSLGVNGTQAEFEKLVEDVHGHALTLSLLGSYLREAHGGDIRKRDLIKLEEADAGSEQGGHAFRVMDAYVHWFGTGGRSAEDLTRGRRSLALVSLLGLFDQTVNADGLAVLLRAPPLAGLTEPLFTVERKWLGFGRVFRPLEESKQNIALSQLERARLLTINRDTSGRLVSLDGHPLLREYLSTRLRVRRPMAYKAAHQRLFEYLCATTKQAVTPPTLQDLQPLYQAITHGCQAGLYQESFEVYRTRILFGKITYTTNILGAYGTDLGAVANFFDSRWCCVSPALSPNQQAWLLSMLTHNLRALGRMTEAHEAITSGLALALAIKHKTWKQVSGSAELLCELKLILGDLGEALYVAKQSITYADQSGELDFRIRNRSTYAMILHQAGHMADAQACFNQVQDLRKERSSDDRTLVSSDFGFCYCDLLLTFAERAAWRATLSRDGSKLAHFCTHPDVNFSEGLMQNVSRSAASLLESCRIAVANSEEVLDLQNGVLVGRLSMALTLVTHGRVELYSALIKAACRKEVVAKMRLSTSPGVSAIGECEFDSARGHLDAALEGFRNAGDTSATPRGLLTRAWLRCLEGHSAGPDSGQTDLDEAWEIAERGPMPLHIIDIHLHRARLFFREEVYPWQSPQHDLAEARRLIEKHGYWRRKEELEDAEAAFRDEMRA